MPRGHTGDETLEVERDADSNPGEVLVRADGRAVVAAQEPAARYCLEDVAGGVAKEVGT